MRTTRLALLSLASALALAGCSDDPAGPLTGPQRPSLSTTGEERVGTEKPLPGDVTAAATIAVAQLAPGGQTALAQSLAGAGVTIQNVSYSGTTGLSASAGTFTNGLGTVGFASGIMLSSGRVIDALGPNNASGTSFNTGTGGDAQLTALSGNSTLNATILLFEIVPDADSVYFQYVFSSEEYNEYVFSPFNDVFAFYVNGQNCALVGSPAVPVSINTINNGHQNSFGVNAKNPALYRNNTFPAAPTIDLEPDGLTIVLTCRAGVNANVANQVKLAIADASDPILDSWVFIEAGSFSTIPPENEPPVLNPIPNQSVDEGSLLTFAATATDDPDQTLTYSLIGAPAGATIHPATGVFSWTPTDDDPTGTPSDVSNVTVQVTDDATPALSATQVVQITVNNVAPAMGAFTTYPAAPVPVGTSVSFKAPFSDPGSGDTFTGNIDWGDASVSAAVIDPFSSISGSHVYATPGVYTVTFSLSDDDLGSDTQVFQYVVVYDPDAGFVTGGGWIDSPAGAYAADPALTGKAHFGFVSKYKKGATTPDGQTQFQFQAGNLNFHSTAYEWLVISGPKAQYKGSGTINGAGDYGFLLTANDGQVSGGGGADKFRLKIWDKATNAVIYDNQAGDGDTAGASTVLGGGSIVIHSK